jgi:dTDP-4-amino-4,6-dideoxygalactose transaminase
MKIPFSKVDCSGNELNYIKEVLDSGWLTTASKSKEFEKKFSERVGAKYALAVNSCTSALHLALEAIGVGPGDKVLVPTMTFTASAEVIRYLGADPVILDVEYGTCAISVKEIAKSLDQIPNIKAIIVVHFAGQAVDVLNDESGSIKNLCRQYGVKIVEDAAHAFPARMGDRMIGNIGDVTCFSFYANKTITTGEGGMLTTNNKDVFERVKLMRLHGIDRDVWDRFNNTRSSWEYDIRAPGFKYNMPDVNAAIGLAQLERSELMRSNRQGIAMIYLEELCNEDMIDLPVVKIPLEDHAWHLFSIVLNDRSLISRDEMIEGLSNRGIGTSVHYKPLHRMTYYRDQYNLATDSYPNAEKIWKGCLSLPISSMLTKEEVRYIVKNVKYLLKGV